MNFLKYLEKAPDGHVQYEVYIYRLFAGVE